MQLMGCIMLRTIVMIFALKANMAFQTSRIFHLFSFSPVKCNVMQAAILGRNSYDDIGLADVAIKQQMLAYL